MSRRWHTLALVALLLIAFGMRLYRLNDLPPGLFHDEAYNTLDAQALAAGLPHPRFYDSWEIYARTVHTTWPPETTRFPVFLEGNYGREPLFHYLGALAVSLVGPRVWALRLVSAVSGVLAVLAAHLVTRELFADEPDRARLLALLAAAVATGMYSLLAFSRLGLRIITLVTFEGFTVALWWRAGRDLRLRRWALAGLLLGLAQYTYIPARLLPLVLACPTLVWLKRRPRRRPQLLRGTLLASFVASAVIAPLFIFFVRYPAYLTLRAEAIAAVTPERGATVMLANVGRAVGGLIWRGDPDPILNLPNRPALDAVQSAFFVIGAIACLVQAHRLRGSFLLLWAMMMHTPSIVSGIAPTFGRSIGGMLPVAIITAIGGEAIWTGIAGRWPGTRSLTAVALTGTLLFSVGLTARDYFTVWAQLPDLPHIFHEDLATVGRYIGELPDQTVVYITPTQKNYATILLAMQRPERRSSVEPGEWGTRDRPRDFYGPAGLVPAGDPGRETAYLILEGNETTANLLEATFPEGQWDVQTTTFAAYRVPSEWPFLKSDGVPSEWPFLNGDGVPSSSGRARPQIAARAEFANRIRLIGFDLPSSPVHPGDTLSIKLTWQALKPMDRGYTAFVHLLGPHNPSLDSPLWAQDDHEPGQATYSTDRWFPGEVVIDAFHLQIPADAPPGEYTLSTGFYELETLQRLSRSDVAGDTATLTTVKLVEHTP